MLKRTISKTTAERPKRGLLVAVEGLDGAGKTTLIQQLAKTWTASPILLTNWNDTRELYNLMMRLNQDIGLDGTTRCLLGAAELAARYEYRILPALESRHVVFANKYLISAMAHSLIRGQPRSYVERIYSFAIAPDLTLYCEITPEEAIARKLSSGTSIGFWEAGLDLVPSNSLTEALHKYCNGEFPDEFIVERFVQFQHKLRELHERELASTPNVVRVDGMSPVEDSVLRLKSILLEVHQRMEPRLRERGS